MISDATLANLQRALLDDYHVFHFIGHGGFDDVTQQGVLVLENGEGGSHRVSGKRLGTLLHDAPNLQLAVLNACEGARSSGRDPFSGVGQALVRQGLPAVVAMRTEISDRAALDFSHEFYWFLTQGLGIDAAMCEVRKAMAVSDEASEWGTAVLLRSGTDQPFTFATAPPASPSTASRPGDDRWESLYGIAIRAAAAGRVDVARPLLEQITIARPGFRDAEARLLALDDPTATTTTLVAPTPAPPATAPAGILTARDPTSPRPPPAPARPAPASRRRRILRSLQNVLRAVGEPRPSSRRRRRVAQGCLASVVIALVALVGFIVWWAVKVQPYADICGSHITSSGNTTPDVTLPCAVEVPRIDGIFDDWESATPHAVPASSSPGSALSASWSARWDEAGLYVFADVEDASGSVGALTDTTAYPLADGLTVLFGDDARRLQAADKARPGDVTVSIAVTTTSTAAGRATDAQLPGLIDVPEVLIGMARSTSGYQLETRIPWSTLGRSEVPEANSVIALCVLVRDGTGEATSTRTITSCPRWTSTPEAMHPGSWQTAILSFDE